MGSKLAGRGAVVLPTVNLAAMADRTGRLQASLLAQKIKTDTEEENKAQARIAKMIELNPDKLYNPDAPEVYANIAKLNDKAVELQNTYKGWRNIPPEALADLAKAKNQVSYLIDQAQQHKTFYDQATSILPGLRERDMLDPQTDKNFIAFAQAKSIEERSALLGSNPDKFIVLRPPAQDIQGDMKSLSGMFIRTLPTTKVQVGTDNFGNALYELRVDGSKMTKQQSQQVTDLLSNYFTAFGDNRIKGTNQTLKEYYNNDPVNFVNDWGTFYGLPTKTTSSRIPKGNTYNFYGGSNYTGGDDVSEPVFFTGKLTNQPNSFVNEKTGAVVNVKDMPEFKQAMKSWIESEKMNGVVHTAGEIQDYENKLAQSLKPSQNLEGADVLDVQKTFALPSQMKTFKVNGNFLYNMDQGKPGKSTESVEFDANNSYVGKAYVKVKDGRIVDALTKYETKKGIPAGYTLEDVVFGTKAVKTLSSTPIDGKTISNTPEYDRMGLLSQMPIQVEADRVTKGDWSKKYKEYMQSGGSNNKSGVNAPSLEDYLKQNGGIMRKGK